MFYEKTLCLHQLSTVSNAQELGHTDFVFFCTQVSPTRWLNQVSHEMPWNYVFIFCCASLAHAKPHCHFSSWRLFKNPERVFVFCQPAKQTYGPEHRMTESWKSRHLQSPLIDLVCMDRNLCWGISSWGITLQHFCFDAPVLNDCQQFTINNTCRRTD